MTPTATRTRAAPALARAAPATGWLLPGVDTLALGLAAALAGAPVWVVGGCVALLAATGRYRPRITMRVGDELPLLLVCVLPFGWYAGTPGLTAAGVGIAATRLAGYAALRAARRRGLLAEPAVIVGDDPVSREIARALAAHPGYGLVPVPWTGNLADLPGGARRVIVGFPDVPDPVLVTALRRIRDAGADVWLVPRLSELGVAGPAAGRDEVWGIPLVPLRRAGRAGLVAKRTLDVVLAAVLLVGFAPLLAVLALAVRRSGPAIFRQLRVTRTGRVATILKLRTLPPDPGADTRWAVPTERCTRLGRLLRRSHADELPQLVNVLRGEMSLVGPRPERPYFTGLFSDEIPGYADRLRVPAGITGWAQVHGLHGDTSIVERARFDNRYAEDRSLWLDLVILARTVLRLGGAR